MKYFSFLICILMKIILSSNIVYGLKNEKIIGGEEATENQFKYQVTIKREGVLACGGGILSDDLIIAVAHCVFDIDSGKFTKKYITVLPSSINLLYQILNKTAVRSYLVKNIYIPKNYVELPPNSSLLLSLEGDITILKLTKKLGIETNLNLLSLLVAPISYKYTNQVFVVAGQGFSKLSFPTSIENEKPYGNSDGKLRFANVTVISKEKCFEIYQQFIPNSSICAHVVQSHKEVSEGTCTGDSGSPLVYDDRLAVGLLVAGPTDCTENDYPAVYINLLHFVWFINSVMRGEKNPNIIVAEWKKRDNRNILSYGYQKT